MPSRVIIRGRPLGTGRYGGQPKCICGAPVTIAGRCDECHDALKRQWRGLPPTDEVQKKRLEGYLKEFVVRAGRCAECAEYGADFTKMDPEDHLPQCSHFEVMPK